MSAFDRVFSAMDRAFDAMDEVFTDTNFVSCSNCGKPRVSGVCHYAGPVCGCRKNCGPFWSRTVKKTWTTQGWSCPKCGRSWSPDTKGCEPCNEVMKK